MIYSRNNPTYKKSKDVAKGTVTEKVEIKEVPKAKTKRKPRKKKVEITKDDFLMDEDNE